MKKRTAWTFAGNIILSAIKSEGRGFLRNMELLEAIECILYYFGNYIKIQFGSFEEFKKLYPQEAEAIVVLYLYKESRRLREKGGE